LVIKFEFLELGGDFIPKMHGMTKFRGACLASLADIGLMKALAYQNRAKKDDFNDMSFALGLMAQRVKQYKFKSSEMMAINDVAKDDKEMENLLTQVTE